MRNLVRFFLNRKNMNGFFFIKDGILTVETSYGDCYHLKSIKRIIRNKI
jgi:hypothetical protein